ncbi:MAG TPA: HAMP domain-containing sensor histidine kinase [Candidatus Eisenbacteria bacterium]
MRCGADPSRASEDPKRVEVLDSLIQSFTERRKTESASTATLEDRDRLLAIFTHDLKNLLSVLSLNTELFLSRRGEMAETNASNMRRAIGRMDRLISSLLDLAKLNAGKLDVTLEPRDAAEVLREAVDMFRPLAAVKSLTLTLSGADGPLTARIDRDRFFQVLSNLLSNAIKFTPEGGEIFVSAGAIDGVVEIVVRDTGVGIPEGDLERVFECYRQLDGSGKDGLGLGLFISRAIVQGHGGRIWATSRPGAGSTFFLTVPMAERASRLVAPSVPAPRPPGRLRTDEDRALCRI